MEYGKFKRAGVYTMQELFRRVKLQQDANAVKVVFY